METGASQQAIQDMATFNLLAKELYGERYVTCEAKHNTPLL